MQAMTQFSLWPVAAMVAVVIAGAATAIGFSVGRHLGFAEGVDKQTIYCNISPDYCRSALKRIGDRTTPPQIYLDLFGK